MTRVPPYPVALWALLALGVALRTVQYAAFPSLWLDELFITFNVTTRAWDELIAPLAYNQVAPIGFLAITKAAAGLFPMPEAGLRLFPYLASVAGLFLFWRVSTRFLEPASRLGAIAIFAMSPALLWYARNVKQYSGDIAVALLLVLLALRFREGRDSPRQAAIAGVVGALAILCSQPAVIVSLVLLSTLFVQRLRSGQPLRPLVFLAMGWIAAGAAVTVTSLILSPESTRKFMRQGWHRRGFMPFGVVTPPWLAYRILLLLGLLVGRFQADTPAELAIAGVFTALSALGLPWLARRKPNTILLLAPLLAAILASGLRILPLSNRVAMFVAPVLLLLSLAGVDQIRAWLPLRAKRLANLAILGMAAIPAAILIFFYLPPDRKEEARPVLEELRERWRPGDRIYITGSSRLAMEYYGRPLGLEWEEATPGSGHPRELLEQADRLRGAPRAWVFYTHAIPCRQQLLRAYLETIGAEVDRIEDPYGLEGKSEAAAHLYDLADPARLSLAGAASFPVPDRIAEHCGYPEDDPWTQVQEQLEEIDPFE